MEKPQDSSAKNAQIAVNHLVPGMEVARDVYCDDGKVLVGAGAVLSSYTITKLKKWHIDAVHILSEVNVNPILDPKVQQFVNTYNKSVTVVQQAFENIRATQEVPLDTFSATAGEISENVRSVGNVIDRLYDLPASDDCTFQHSVNVGVIAALIATWLDYPQPVVNAVSLAGLLHDVGKAQLPVALLNQPNKLPAADYEHYKRHSAYGYEMVRDLPDLSESIKSTIVQHHERNDGGGYPYRLTADKIHPYAKIVAIADQYDEALTVNREPEITSSPYNGLEQLDTLKYRLDVEICLMFINRMLNCLSGNIVALTDGRQGRVAFLNTVQPSRSIVQLTDGTVLDLSDHPDLRIHYVIR
ncbi:MAG: HD domain-containing protein [Negativicutes bacterium]|nr:HD domain-containing protein [Negativicutes bacterium]